MPTFSERPHAEYRHSSCHWSSILENIAEASLPAFLRRQRWYPAKDAGSPTAKVSALLPFSASQVPAVAAVWQVTPPGQSPIHLFVPVALVPDAEADASQVIAQYPSDTPDSNKMCLVEAFCVDAFVRAWVKMLLQGSGEGFSDVHLGTWRTHQLAPASLEAADNWAIKRGSAEQSNTSIRIADNAILKVIRKLEPGLHSELEMSRFLTATAVFKATPALLAWSELDQGNHGGTVVLSVLHSFVPNDGDGWSWGARAPLGRCKPEGERY